MKFVDYLEKIRTFYGFEVNLSDLKKFEEFENKQIEILLHPNFLDSNSSNIYSQVFKFNNKKSFQNFFNSISSDKTIYIYSFKMVEEKPFSFFEKIKSFFGYKKKIFSFRGLIN